MTGELHWLDLFPQDEPSMDESMDWPAGMFIMQVDNARIGFTRQGLTKLLITFLCKEGERAGLSYEWHLVCTPNKARYFFERLKTLGADPEFLLANPSLSEVCKHITSDRLYKVTFREYEFDNIVGIKISWLERA